MKLPRLLSKRPCKKRKQILLNSVSLLHWHCIDMLTFFNYVFYISINQHLSSWSLVTVHLHVKVSPLSCLTGFIYLPCSWTMQQCTDTSNFFNSAFFCSLHLASLDIQLWSLAEDARTKHSSMESPYSQWFPRFFRCSSGTFHHVTWSGSISE